MYISSCTERQVGVAGLGRLTPLRGVEQSGGADAGERGVDPPLMLGMMRVRHVRVEVGRAVRARGVVPRHEPARWTRFCLLQMALGCI